MKHTSLFCMALLFALTLRGAGTFDIFSHYADGWISPSSINGDHYVIAGTGALAGTLWYNGIVFFQLPTNRIEAANLTFPVALLYGNWTTANAGIDVWGLGYMSAPLMNKAWTLRADADTRSLINTNFPYEVQSTKIADNLVTNGQNVAPGNVFSLNAGQCTNLLAFINSLYEKGAVPGDYAVIRVNQDAAMTVDNTSVRFGRSSEVSPDDRTKLTVTLSDAPVPTPAEIAVRNFSNSNDGCVFSNGVDATYDLISSTLANPTKDGSGVAFFALPEQRMTSASFAFTVASFYNAMSNANIDVWGLGYQASPALNKAWLCTNDVDSRVLLNGYPPVKLADNIVTSGQTVAAGNVWQPTAVQQTNLLNYMNGLYERGAKPGDFAVIRLNMDASQAGPTAVQGVRWGGSHQTSPDRRAVLTGFFPATTNYLVNAGFEAGAGGVASNWTITANGFQGLRTNVSVRSLGYAFRMAVHGDPAVTNTANNLNIAQDVTAPDFAGKLVTLSGYVRHDTTEPLVAGSVQKVEARIYWLGGSQGNTFVTSTDYHNLLPTDVKDAHKPIYISAVAPEDVTGVKAMVIFRSGTNVDPTITTGAAFLDDLRLAVFEPLSAPAGTLLLFR